MSITQLKESPSLNVVIGSVNSTGGATFNNTSNSVITSNYTGSTVGGNDYVNGVNLQIGGNPVGYLQYAGPNIGTPYGVALLNGAGTPFLKQASGSTSDNSLLSKNNTLDDGNGNMIINGTLTIPGARQQVSISLLPTAGASGTITANFNFSRIGDTVNLSFPSLIGGNVTGGGGHWVSNSGAIPSLYRPLTNPLTIFVQSEATGTVQNYPGLVIILTDGTVLINYSVSTNYWPAGLAPNGVFSQATSYSIY